MLYISKYSNADVVLNCLRTHFTCFRCLCLAITVSLDRGPERLRALYRREAQYLMSRRLEGSMEWFFKIILLYCNIQSSLPIPPFLGLVKNLWYSKTAALRGSISFKNPIWDLKWVAVLGGRRCLEGRYWEGRMYHILKFHTIKWSKSTGLNGVNVVDLKRSPVTI